MTNDKVASFVKLGFFFSVLPTLWGAVPQKLETVINIQIKWSSWRKKRLGVVASWGHFLKPVTFVSWCLFLLPCGLFANIDSGFQDLAPFEVVHFMPAIYTNDMEFKVYSETQYTATAVARRSERKITVARSSAPYRGTSLWYSAHSWKLGSCFSVRLCWPQLHCQTSCCPDNFSFFIGSGTSFW